MASSTSTERIEGGYGFAAAIQEARIGAMEGGVPIGAALVSENGQILGRGRNMRVQKGSATLHFNGKPKLKAEMSALENSGRLPASSYANATMYTTLSPCLMCTGACAMYGIKRVVIGENETFLGGEEYLKQRGVDVVVLNNTECKEMMKNFIQSNPEIWHEDIGVVA